MRTSFHDQPEAQHPKFFSYPQAAGRLPHLWGGKRTSSARFEHFRFRPISDILPMHVMRRTILGWRCVKVWPLSEDD